MRIHSPYPASWALAQRIGYLYSEGEIIYLADTPFERLLDIQRQVGQCQTMTSLSQADFEARLEAVFHQNTGESQQIAQDIDQSVDLLSLSEEMRELAVRLGLIFRFMMKTAIILMVMPIRRRCHLHWVVSAMCRQIRFIIKQAWYSNP